MKIFWKNFKKQQYIPSHQVSEQLSNDKHVVLKVFESNELEGNLKLKIVNKFNYSIKFNM